MHFQGCFAWHSKDPHHKRCTGPSELNEPQSTTPNWSVSPKTLNISKISNIQPNTQLCAQLFSLCLGFILSTCGGRKHVTGSTQRTQAHKKQEQESLGSQDQERICSEMSLSCLSNPSWGWRQRQITWPEYHIMGWMGWGGCLKNKANKSDAVYQVWVRCRPRNKASHIAAHIYTGRLYTWSSVCSISTSGDTSGSKEQNTISSWHGKTNDPKCRDCHIFIPFSLKSFWFGIMLGHAMF